MRSPDYRRQQRVGQASTSSPALILTILLPFGAGYFLANLLRTLNAILAPRLASELDLTASELGFLTSVYFIAFAAAQIPVGIALDRWGARRVASILLAIAAVGMLAFAFARTVTELAVARALIGLGVSACLMAALKANSMAWSPERLPLVNGLTASMGMLGSIVSTIPVELAMASIGWRGLLVMLALITTVVAAAIGLVSPRTKLNGNAPLSLSRELRQLLRLAVDARFLRLAVPATLHTATYLAYQSLWAGPWLRDVAGLDSTGIATTLFAFNVGMLIGALAGSWLAGRLANFGISTAGCLMIGLSLSLATQLLLVLQLSGYPILIWFAFGLFCSTWFLAFAVLGREFEKVEMGRVSTLLNVMIFVAAFAAQWAIGLVLGLWPSDLGAGFSRQGHQIAFALLLALEVLGFIWFVFSGPPAFERC